MILTDHRFFTECIDYSLPQLNNVKQAAESGDFAVCRVEFAKYVRTAFDAEKYFRVFPFPKEMSDKTFKTAEDACRNILTSVGISYDFKDNIDWEFNPTENNYGEWTWQLNRHEEWLALAEAFHATGDKKYLDAFCLQLESWLKQADVPPIGTARSATKCWRTIEAGIRQMRWATVIHAFYRDMPDDLLIDWCKSVFEHGERLYHDHSPGSNWLMMEINGLATLSILYPWLKCAEKWLLLCDAQFVSMLERQIYPDDTQYELSTSYQSVCTLNYARPMKLYRAYGRPVPKSIVDTLKGIYDFYVKLRMPNGFIPALNDAEYCSIDGYIKTSEGLLSTDLLDWAMGKTDKEPPFRSVVLEYAGIVALRTGWGEDDTFICVDCAPLGVAHSHEDKLSLTLYANGRPLLCEGNNYAYDSSDMRKYVISTQSHNTVTVDGRGQSRRRIKKPQYDLTQKVELQYNFTDEVDFISAEYREGYGTDPVLDVTHRRGVYFFKQIKGLEPFAVVVDRLIADKEHSYDFLWHIDTKHAASDGLKVEADGLDIIVPEDTNAELNIVCGQTEPSVQGFTCNSAVQGDYRPVPTAIYTVKGASLRLVTVLYPNGKNTGKIAGVVADSDPNVTEISLLLCDGREIKFSENL